jgi:CBS domain-containing protein
VRAITAKGKAVFEMPVSEFMTREVVTCARRDKIEDLMHRMSEGRFRHLPVLEDGLLVGVISIGDVVRSRVEDVEKEKNALYEYIHSP